MRKAIHPFLFAMVPVLFLFAYNIEETPATDLPLPLLASLVGTLLLFFMLRLFTKDYKKGAILTSFFLLLFFSYGHVRELIFPPIAVASLTQNLLLVSLWGLLLFIGAFLVVKSHRSFSAPTRFLNIVAIILVAISLVNIGVYEVKASLNVPGDIAIEELNKPSNPPDIYYIILDGYTRQDVLKEELGYDNSGFIDSLESRGFYVASKSSSSCGATACSLAASLNMKYLEAEESGSLPRMINMVADSRVSRLLKSCDYLYIYVPANINWKGMGRYAEVYSYKGAFGIKVTEFTYGLIETTMLSPFARYFSSHGADSIVNAFDVLADMPNIKEPKFVYAHIMCPHAPWLFDSDGPKEFSVFETEDNLTGYLDNLMFINGRVEALVDELISKSDVPPIIILQSDHGTTFSEEGVWKYRYEILNAYYLPEGGSRLLYETVPPVNTFRIIFNFYFGADYELLGDEKL